MAFEITRGTNISHWLSQSRRRGADRAAFFTQDDVQRIAEVGFDHVRIPIDEEQMWRENSQPDEEAFALLDAALDWCEQEGLRAIIDLHVLRSHHFMDHAPLLYSNPAEQQRFNRLWLRLSQRLRKRPLDLVAYELLNEPAAADAEDWNRVAASAFSTVRSLEPQRTIVLGSNDANKTYTFDQLDVPDDDNLILSLHFYHPTPVTHYATSWTPMTGYHGPVHYPGVPVHPEDMAGLEDAVREFIEEENDPFDRLRMVSLLARPLAVRERTGRPLHCGEFGCYLGTPQPVRVAWYADFVQTLREHGIAYTNWAYKGDFGLVRPEGWDEEIASILLG
jgi:endoglucanase